MALLSLGLLTACGPSGHLPAEVTGWTVIDRRSIEVDVRFEADAPAYGCEVDALAAGGRSIGYVIAEPGGDGTGTFRMPLDRGTADEIDSVAVVDCGT